MTHGPATALSLAAVPTSSSDGSTEPGPQALSNEATAVQREIEEAERRRRLIAAGYHAERNDTHPHARSTPEPELSG
jgi:hypothetical protein